MLNEKESRRNNNLEKSCTEKKARHEPSGWAMLTKCSFDEEENKLDYYRGKDCIDELCKKLKEPATKICNYKEKKMIPLTKKENKSYEEQDACHICEGKFCVQMKMMKIIKIKKRLRITVTTHESLEELLIASVI